MEARLHIYSRNLGFVENIGFVRLKCTKSVKPRFGRRNLGFDDNLGFMEARLHIYSRNLGFIQNLGFKDQT